MTANEQELREALDIALAALRDVASMRPMGPPQWIARSAIRQILAILPDDKEERDRE